jgi:predicted metal-dependent hydrolase
MLVPRTTSLRVPGRELAVEIRESSRARRLTIKVAPGRSPEVVVPVGTRRREIEKLLRRNSDWIERKTEELRRAAADDRLRLGRPGVVWVHGEAIPIVHLTGGRPVASLRDGALRVRGHHVDAPAAIERWYRREARRRLERICAREAEALGVSPRRISVRDQRTRWGSCSPSGSLSFSWRLLLAPLEVMDYVAVHELCHLRELNHSPAFWALLAEARPGWPAQAAWLKEHAIEIGGYRPQLA